MSNKRIIDKSYGEIRFEEKIKSTSIGINYSYEFRLKDNTSLNPFAGYEINIFTSHEATHRRHMIKTWQNFIQTVITHTHMLVQDVGFVFGII